MNKWDREFELEQLHLAVKYYEKQLEDYWYTSHADRIQNNISKFKNKYRELEKWTQEKSKYYI
tara:strand:+ start:956 stop:1144 length:189 start_codon:yes stop_codon:yes gene_type:complete